MEFLAVTAVLLIFILTVVGFVIAIYNRLVQARLGVREGWSAIEVQLQRRASLIPNLVQTVQGYASHERGTFDSVTSARARTQQATGPRDAAQAEGALTQALRTLFAVAEAYPDLKASANFRDLQAQLGDTEDKISYARNYYNGRVIQYNSMVNTIPSNFIAGLADFKEAEFFDAPTTAEAEVKVSFA